MNSSEQKKYRTLFIFRQIFYMKDKTLDSKKINTTLVKLFLLLFTETERLESRQEHF